MNYGALPLSDDGDERGELLGGGGGDQKKCVVALSWCRVFVVRRYFAFFFGLVCVI